MDSIQDPYGRQIDYLRISVTDRCNLRCIYCIPSKGVLPFESKNILTYEEIVRVVRLAAGFGVCKIRITGGEPLMRKDLQRLIESISRVETLTSESRGNHDKVLCENLTDMALLRAIITRATEMVATRNGLCVVTWAIQLKIRSETGCLCSGVGTPCLTGRMQIRAGSRTTV